MSTYRVQNPATGEVLETFETASDTQIADAIERADDVYREWRMRSVHDRAGAIQRIADLVRERSAELARMISLEMGKSTSEAVEEVEFAASIFEYYAVHGPSLITDYEIPSSIPGKARIEQRPIGVLLGVMPWNFPTTSRHALLPRTCCWATPFC